MNPYGHGNLKKNFASNVCICPQNDKAVIKFLSHKFYCIRTHFCEVKELEWKFKFRRKKNIWYRKTCLYLFKWTIIDYMLLRYLDFYFTKHFKTSNVMVCINCQYLQYGRNCILCNYLNLGKYLDTWKKFMSIFLFKIILWRKKEKNCEGDYTGPPLLILLWIISWWDRMSPICVGA